MTARPASPPGSPAMAGVTMSEHTGDGRWTVVERGRIVPDGSYEPAGRRADDASAGFGSSGSGSAGSVSSRW